MATYPAIAGLKSLTETLRATPELELQFFEFGIILKKYDGAGVTEFAVDPNQLAVAFNTEAWFETGLLSEDILFVAESGLRRVVIGYRPPQVTGLWVEGLPEAYRIPMPGLVLSRVTRDGRPDYNLFAVHERPRSGEAELFVAPLPHVYTHGGICWGSVERPAGDHLATTDLTADWDALLGSAFNNHAVNGKSKRHGQDVLSLYPELEQSGAESYPLDDLVPVNKTLGNWLKELRS